MNNETIAMIQEQIGYRFKNTDLLQQAFIRRSYSKENGGENNEILEFIGDKALDLIIVKKLTEYYGYFAKECDGYDPREDWNEFICEYNEGKLTEIKKKLVCREMLARRIRTFGFQYELIMGKGDKEKNIQDQESVQEDLFEAIIGAVALDSNWDLEKLSNVIDLMLDPDFYLENGFDEENNYVELLQQWYQKKHNMIPKYHFENNAAMYIPLRTNLTNIYSAFNVRTTIYDAHNANAANIHNSYDNICCELTLSHLETFRAYGSTQKEARMAVAKKAYEYLEDNGLLYTLVDEVGEPELDRAINQLQELYQKGYIGEPWYNFREMHDSNGNPVWRCECHVQGRKTYYWDDFSSKKYGKKKLAYDMLCDILDEEDSDEA